MAKQDAPKPAQQAQVSMAAPIMPIPAAMPMPAAEPPADLPSLDFEKKLSAIDFSTEEEKKAQASMQTPAVSSQSAPAHELPAEIQKAKMAKQASPESQALSAMAKKLSSEQRSVGFFSTVLEHVQKEDGAKEKLLEGDLFGRMSNYWELKKHEIKTGTSLSSREQLEKELLSCLESLRTLEQKWQVQKMALEEDIKYLEQREREIQLKSQELRRISNEILLFKNSKPEQYFRLRNGMVLKSLHDLVDCLEVIDDASFMHHVNPSRNDFADWIRNVFMDVKLADKMIGAKSRHEMIEALFTTPFMQQRMKKMNRVPPSQYFYLSNGVVLKSLADLSDALKEMSDELLHSHITYDRNDFANWVRNTFKEESLALAFERAKSRSDMISAIDVYL